MTAWDSLRSFHPTALEQALLGVEELHSLILTPPDPPADTIEELKCLLDETDLLAIPELAGQLRRDLAIAIPDLVLLEERQQILEKARVLAAALKNKAIVMRAWKLIVSTMPAVELVEIVRDGLRNGLHDAVTADESSNERLERWFIGNDLPASMLQDLESQQLSFDSWLNALPTFAHNVPPDSPVAEELKCRVLSIGSTQTLEAHHNELLQWVLHLSGQSRAALREQFAANYLDKLTEGKRWREEVIDWIFEVFGLPKPNNLVDTWRRIDRRSPGVVRALLSWIALKELARFFDDANDPHGRFSFWKNNFADDFAYVQPLADREAMLLHLPPLAVVEFAEMGNAAYVYPESELSWLSATGSHDVSYFKRKDRLASRPSDYQDFRILHHRGWQQRYLNDIKSSISSRRRNR